MQWSSGLLYMIDVNVDVIDLEHVVSINWDIRTC